MKCGYDPSALKEFNKVGAPAPYNLYGKVRYRKLDELYEILFSRAVFNGTGDTKANNAELARILGISDRQVRSLVGKLEDLGQIKTFSVTYFTGGGVKTSRIIRVLPALAFLNYNCKDRATVFGKRRGEQFDYSMLNSILLEDRRLRHQTHVEVDEIPLIPEWADDPAYTSNPDFMEKYKPVTDVVETGMDILAKLREGVIPGFLIQRYYELRAGWEELDFRAILILGTEKAVKRTLKRLGNTDEHDVPSIEA